ncbi:MAG: hypothetical protein AB7G47_11295 [Mycolicibacterium sp.]|uniref:hypothetical protein n=1 Tax=Mycolicibacterium sp. TaxID=2320850 RepID=UPI003D098E75
MTNSDMTSSDALTGVRIAGGWPTFHTPASAAATAAPRKRRAAGTTAAAASVNRSST